MKNILTLNAISPVINDVFDSSYNVSSDVESPVGIMLRSFKMHDYIPAKNTVAVARAGAGTNNIPVEENAIGKTYSVSESFSNLYEVCKTIATQSEIGWRIKFENGLLTLEVYAGTDRSQTVQFSTSFDSLVFVLPILCASSKNTA